MPTAIINNARLNYVQLGEGPDLVMVHGLAASLAYWYVQVAPELARHFRVTLYDLRGHGFSEPTPSGYTTDSLAGDLLALLDLLKIERPHLVGHSYGGAVSLHLAVRHPQRVASLSLIDCRVNALQPIHGMGDTEHWRQQREELIAAGIDVPEGTPKIVYAMLKELVPPGGVPNPQPEGTPGSNGLPGLIFGYGRWNPNSRAAQRWLKLVGTTKFPDEVHLVHDLTERRIADMKLPTLLSYGLHSLCLPSFEGLHHLLPHAQVRLHPDVGHFFPTIRPDLVVDDVLSFLNVPQSPAALCAAHAM